MPCTVCGPRSRGRSRNVEISGTWDYKWPRGTQIRVAFQRRADLSAEEFSEVTGRVIDLARRWERSIAGYLERNSDWRLTPTDFASNGISFDFSRDSVYDPPLGADAPDGSELRSPYRPEDLAARDYDVLISLDDLPIVREDPFRTPIAVSSPELELEDDQEGVQHIILPFTALGSYARRIDYGLPTAFLGNPMGKPESAKPADSLRTYIDSTGGAHVIVHEFGHILGLAHAHQAPQFAEASFRSPEEIAQILKVAFALQNDIPSRFIREQITARWPGNLGFSDWRVPHKLEDLHSVMAHPSLPLMLNSADGDPTLGAEEFARMFVLPELKLTSKQRSGFTEPTDLDVETLLLMYGGHEARKALEERDARSFSSSRAPRPA